jgi:3-methyladenine DNA glycosylase AlkD
MTYLQIKKELGRLADLEQAHNLQRFFKTGPGEYGEGDIFIGIKMPALRQVVKKYRDMPLPELQFLLDAKVHEYRMTALLILVEQFPGNEEEIYDFYIKNYQAVNNWDLVDVTVPKVVGQYWLKRPKGRNVFFEVWSGSDNLWQRRIAVLATFPFIANNEFDPILKLAHKLLDDEHDLIHKAVGWMLRESGKRDIGVLLDFLDQNTPKMPRTMLRYAIEKLPEAKRQYYLKLK